MKYTIGTVIPAKEITKRFRDEDGEIFLEIRDMKDVLFRVTDGDRVYYKIEKDKMKGEDLTLIVDYTLARPKSLFINNTPTDKVKTVKEDNAEVLDVGSLWGTEPIFKKKPQKPKEQKVFEEGEKIPKHLKEQCRKNDYGGYTLRFNKYLYMLDEKYRIEIKSPDTDSHYILPDEDQSAPLLYGSGENENPDNIFNLTDPISVEEDETSGAEDDEIELQVGDVLPARLRAQCEALLGYGYGSRITFGDYLYLLDPNFKVIQKMKISYIDDGDDKDKKASPSTINETRGKKMIERDGLPPKKIVANLTKVIRDALERYEIKADYYKDTVLIPNHFDILVSAYHGNLDKLNDDTQEAAVKGKSLLLPEKERGFNLLKASLIHEFYIKSTLSGRGNKAKFFLTHIYSTSPDGKVGNLLDNIPLEEQKKIVEYFKNRSLVYTDKTDIIRRVHVHIRNTIFGHYKESWLNKENVRFNALLICKLYENTTRLDRGDGITMIRLTRDLLDYKINNN